MKTFRSRSANNIFEEIKEIHKEGIIREKLKKAKKSPFKLYKNFTVGDVSTLKFVLYEILIFFLGPMPGAIGFFLRKKFYPLILRFLVLYNL